MTTLNRNFSQNVLHHPESVKCAKCNHSIEYSSKTYFDQTGKHIGLDCWEKEKELRKIERERLQNIKKQEQREIDLKSEFIGNVGDKVCFRVRLEKTIFLCESTFGYSSTNIYLNIFRDVDNNIIVYKGKLLLFDYLAVCFSDILENAKSKEDYSGSILTLIGDCKNYPDFNEEINGQPLIDFYKNNIKNYSESDEDRENGYKKDIDIINDGIYITLSGTIKENMVYKDIKQTLIQRPKMR